MNVWVTRTALVNTPPESGDLKLRRLPRLDRMALEAARRALGEASVTPALGLVFGTGYGGLTATAEFLEGVAERGYPFGSPTSFHQSVHHSAAGQISIAMGIQGPSLTLSARELSGETAVRAALDLLETGRADRVLVVAADERTPVLDAGYRAFGVFDHFSVGEGAAAVLLETHLDAGGVGGPSIQVERCSLTAHPCKLLHFPSESQLQPLLQQALQATPGIGRVSIAAPMPTVQHQESRLVAEVVPGALQDRDGERFGFHGSAGLMRWVAAAERLAQSTPGEACLIHGVSLGGGQAVSVLRRC